MNNCEKCGYYLDGECNICGMGIDGEDTFCRLCKDNANCYYKQLSELKAENEKLKEEIKNKDILLDVAVSETGKNGTHADKYYTCLQEIKEIAEAASLNCNCADAEPMIDCVDCTVGGEAKIANKILQKIAECEVG